jgi:hypothetical protein
MKEGLPVISLWQPWAAWVALGWKTIETRTHRRFDVLACRRIGIHASKFWDKSAMDAARPYLSAEQLAIDHTLYYRRGELLCTARTGNPDPSWLSAADSKAALIDCDPAKVIRFGLWLSEIEMMEPPLKVKGGQGIFYVQLPRGSACEAKERAAGP